MWLSGCATVKHGSYETIHIMTDPPGARAVTDIETYESKRARKDDPDRDPDYIGCSPTPCQINLNRRQEAVVEFRYDGYEPYEAAIVSDVRRDIKRKEKREAKLKTRAEIDPNAAIAVTGMTGLLASFPATSGVFLASTAGTAFMGTFATAGVGTVGLTLDGVDSVTGARLMLRPNPMVVRLVPTGQTYTLDPEVKSLRQRRSKPSIKPPLSTQE